MDLLFELSSALPVPVSAGERHGRVVVPLLAVGGLTAPDDQNAQGPAWMWEAHAEGARGWADLSSRTTACRASAAESPRRWRS
jgi:hypothetical protein